MELISPYLAQLGIAGSIFVLLLALLQLGLTQFFKVVLRRFSWGEAIQGGVVLIISLVVGGLLGWVMLGPTALLLDIALPPPFAGIVAGLVLAATVSGLVSYAQQRAQAREAGRVTPDMLAGLISGLAATPTGATRQPAAPIYTAEDLAGTLRPITPEEASAMTRTDWPDSGLADEALLVIEEQR